MEKALEFGKRCINSRQVPDDMAVMFDIDDTLTRTDGTPISEMIQLFNLCRAKGYVMVVITARPAYNENIEHTKRELRALGVHAHKLVFASPQHKSMAKQLLKLHFFLSVGDMYTDLGESDHYIKLPDHHDKNVYTK